ncbi:MAG: ferritin-like domain-containing protein [Nocardioidaceae bacterium]|nr:ferritin-like domain-containing protein [Nocardioidaceae bacterium]MCO5324573.1 ferritin-like domain-containing protein [Nocardioidaceae bacterium]
MSDPKVPGIQAMQEALADEHAAVYLFGLLGARVSEREQPALFDLLSASFADHRRNRDDLSQMIAAAGDTPVASAVAYDPPGPVDTPSGIRRTAVKLEKRMTLRYGALIANTTMEQRVWAITALREGAMREIAYGVAPQDLPGVKAG